MCIIDSSGERDSVHKFNIKKVSSSNQTQKKTVDPRSQIKPIFSSATGPETKQGEKKEQLFIRTGREIVPPLKVTGLTSQSGPLTDRPVATYTFGNLKEAIKDANKQKKQENSFRNNAIGVGDMGPLQSMNTGQTQPVKRPSSAPRERELLTPTPPGFNDKSSTSVSAKKRLGLGLGGHKRTRKHRSAGSSAPATRRHRDHSSTNASSSHKRTRRRQRPQRREH